MKIIDRILDNIDSRTIEKKEKSRYRPDNTEQKLKDQNKRNEEKRRKIISAISNYFFIPIVIAILGFIIEYGFIQPYFSSDIEISPKLLPISQLSIISLFIYSNSSLISIWRNRDNYFREKFTFNAFISIFTIILLGFISLIMKTTPWHLGRIFQSAISKDSHLFKFIDTTEFSLLLVLIVFYIYVVSQYYANWDGRISINQYEKEEFKGTTSFYAELITEIYRRIDSNEPLREYSDPQFNLQPVLPQLDITSSAWNDQARELVMLFSISYAFDYDLDWHDIQKCWIGNNQRSNKMVLLIPRHELIEKKEISDLITYAKNIVLEKNNTLESVIIAIKNDEHDIKLTIKNLPVQITSESILLNGLINLIDYKNDIRKKVIYNTLTESQLTLDQVYVRPRIKIKDGVSDSDLEDYLNNWLEESSRRHIAILGDYGQGKSTAALMLTYNLLFKNANNARRIPLLIELQGTNLRDQDVSEILGRWASKYKMNGQALLRLHEAGRLLLIFEGFDEIPQLADYETRRRHFKALWAFSAYTKSNILITGRPNLFESTKEMESALGIIDPFPGAAFCEPLKLLPFNLIQIQTALRSHPIEVKTNIDA